MWACAALLARTDVYKACCLPTLAEWTLPATCTSAPCVSPLARPKSARRILVHCFWVLVAMFSPPFISVFLAAPPRGWSGTKRIMYALCTPSVCVCMCARYQSNKVKCRAVARAFAENEQEHCSLLDWHEGDNGWEASQKDEFDFTGRFALDSACGTQF